MFDFVVVGEVCLDNLPDKLANTNYTRPGGAFYSAYAAKKMGLGQVAILGHTGEEDAESIISVFKKFDINDSFIERIPGKATQYQFENIDEILPQIAIVTRNNFNYVIKDKIPDTQSVLFYPYPGLDNLISRWPSHSLKGLDVQYDAESLFGLSSLNQIDFVFISSSDVISKLQKPLIEIVNSFLSREIKAVITKFGPGGSSIYLSSGEQINIPAFESNYLCTIGAGDVYNAVFMSEYVRHKDYKQAGLHASAAAAKYIERLEFDNSFWDFEKLTNGRTKHFLHPEQAKQIKLYLAGPFFSKGELATMLFVFSALKKCNFTIFSPWHAKGVVSGLKESRDTFTLNRDQIDKSDIVVAILDYEDPGTVWECGYAYARKKPVYAFQTTSDSLNLMVSFSTQAICSSIRSLIEILYNRYAKYEQ